MRINRRFCPLKLIVIGYASGVFTCITISSWPTTSFGVRLVFLFASVFPLWVAYRLLRLQKHNKTECKEYSTSNSSRNIFKAKPCTEGNNNPSYCEEYPKPFHIHNSLHLRMIIKRIIARIKRWCNQKQIKPSEYASPQVLFLRMKGFQLTPLKNTDVFAAHMPWSM